MSYAKPPKAVTLDIDDTVDVVHGHQELAQWNAHYDERCFLPIHVYDATTGAAVVVILRPGKTPSGVEVRKLLSRLIGRIRRQMSCSIAWSNPPPNPQRCEGLGLFRHPVSESRWLISVIGQCATKSPLSTDRNSISCDIPQDPGPEKRSFASLN
jgi:hypothetical protein